MLMCCCSYTVHVHAHTSVLEPDPHYLLFNVQYKSDYTNVLEFSSFLLLPSNLSLSWGYLRTFNNKVFQKHELHTSYPQKHILKCKLTAGGGGLLRSEFSRHMFSSALNPFSSHALKCRCTQLALWDVFRAKDSLRIHKVMPSGQLRDPESWHVKQ